MTDIINQYSAKILLFGEYTVLTGGAALAVPFHHYGSSWQSVDKSLLIYQSFWKLVDPLVELPLSSPLDQKQINIDKEEGIQLVSSIPFGAGLGSSGNLCAAIYHRYFCKDRMLTETNLQRDLIILESYFHGKSSGMDPLCIFWDQPTIYEDNTIKRIEKPIHHNELHFFILDSKTPRNTKDLVRQYNQSLKDENFVKAVNKIEQRNDKCIKWLLKDQPTLVHKHFRKLSQLQYENWHFMIPEQMKETWKTGLKSRNYHLKLCGAGGGGYFLGLANEQAYLPENAILL